LLCCPTLLGARRTELLSSVDGAGAELLLDAEQLVVPGQEQEQGNCGFVVQDEEFVIEDGARGLACIWPYLSIHLYRSIYLSISIYLYIYIYILTTILYVEIFGRVLGQALGAARRAGLDLPRLEPDGQIGDERYIYIYICVCVYV